jgi:hypothetical protein
MAVITDKNLLFNGLKKCVYELLALLSLPIQSVVLRQAVLASLGAY